MSTERLGAPSHLRRRRARARRGGRGGGPPEPVALGPSLALQVALTFMSTERLVPPSYLSSPFTRSGRPHLSSTLKMFAPPRFIAATARTFERLSGMLPTLAYQRL